MSDAELPSHPEIGEAVLRLCADFPGEYLQRLDRDRIYPAEFVRTLTEAGFLSILIPEQYGGSGLGLGAATAVLEAVERGGPHARDVPVGGAADRRLAELEAELRRDRPGALREIGRAHV